MSHACIDCGLEHEVPAIEAPVVVEAETTAVAAVEIAAIEADRDVTLARIGVKAEEGDQLTRIAELEGRLAGIQETLDRMSPPPEPEPAPVPVVVSDPEPAPEETPGAVPPPIVDTPPTNRRKSSPWW